MKEIKYIANVHKTIGTGDGFAKVGSDLYFSNGGVLGPKSDTYIERSGVVYVHNGKLVGQSELTDSRQPTYSAEQAFISKKFSPEVHRVYGLGEEQLGKGERGLFIHRIGKENDITDQVREILENEVKVEDERVYQTQIEGQAKLEAAENWRSQNSQRYDVLNHAAWSGHNSAESNLEDETRNLEISGLEMDHMRRLTGNLWNYAGD